MSEQQAEQSGGADTGPVGAGPAVPNSAEMPSETVTASAQDARSVESPTIAPGAEAVKADEPKVETKIETKAEEKPDATAEAPKAEMPKAEPFKPEAVAADASKPDAVNAEAAKPELIKSEVIKPEVARPEVTKPASSRDQAPKSEAAKSEPAKSEPARIDAVKAERGRARELLVMSPRDDWKRVKANLEKGSFEKSGFEKARFESHKSAPEPEKEAPPAHNGRRRLTVMAAMLALAVVAGAAGGAFATLGLSHFTETASAPPPNTPNTSALEASVARIDSDIMALKAGLEQTTKAGLAQFNKTSDRLERIEKAQSEPNAKLARLSEAVDKLHAAAPAQAAVAAAPAAVAAAAPRDVTGTVTSPAGAQPLPMPQVSPTAATAGTTPRTEVGRLPTVDNWVLRDVSHGSALIEGRTGLYEVFAGDPVPGLGRVEAIRKQDGRWVVVTPKGLIVAR